jgi:transposase
MARAYSLDLRKRVVAAVGKGQSRRAVARIFGLSASCVVKWMQLFRATGSAAAKPIGRRRPFAVAGEREWLLARVAEKPDITLKPLTAELAARGLKVSHFAVWNFLRREGLSFKKNAARKRTRSARRGPAKGPVEEVSRSI